jgi:hypothetical protein
MNSLSFAPNSEGHFIVHEAKVKTYLLDPLAVNRLNFELTITFCAMTLSTSPRMASKRRGMKPEQQARVSKNTLLQQEGWNVCYAANANIHTEKGVIKGVALALLPLNNGFGFVERLLYIDGEAASVIKFKKENTILNGAEVQFSPCAQGLPLSSPAQIRRTAEADLNMNRDMRLHQSILQSAFSCAKGA